MLIYYASNLMNTNIFAVTKLHEQCIFYLRNSDVINTDFTLFVASIAELLN